MVQDNLTPQVANGDLENSLIPNWLLIWTDKQISVWQNNDLDIKIFFYIQSEYCGTFVIVCLFKTKFCITCLFVEILKLRLY